MKALTFLFLFFTGIAFSQESMMFRDSTHTQIDVQHFERAGKMLQQSSINQSVALFTALATSLGYAILKQENNKEGWPEFTLVSGGIIFVGFQIGAIEKKFMAGRELRKIKKL